jgi:site-specific DNA-cytosine methylase
MGGNVDELTSVEICAGAGGQALGLEQAGFAHEAVIELDADACETLRQNRGAQWKVVEDDVANVDGRAFRQLDLFAGGVPCPPFSIAVPAGQGGQAGCAARRRMTRTVRRNLTRSGSMPASVAARQIRAEMA